MGSFEELVKSHERGPSFKGVVDACLDELDAKLRGEVEAALLNPKLQASAVGRAWRELRDSADPKDDRIRVWRKDHGVSRQ